VEVLRNPDRLMLRVRDQDGAIKIEAEVPSERT